MFNLSSYYFNRYVYLFYGVIFCLLLLLNLLTPLWGDDWWRAVEIADFSAIFTRIYDEYYAWGGRLSVLFFTFLALLKYPASNLVFAIINSLVFCLLLASIFRGAIGRWPSKEPSDLLTIFCIFICVWFFTESFGEAILWKTGAVAYLWVITFSILIINPFIDLLAEERIKTNTWIGLFILPMMTLLLAIGLENVSVSLAIFMLFTLIYSTFYLKRPPLWYWLVAIGQVIGGIILVSAPGNYIRYEEQSSGLNFFERFDGLIDVIWQHFSQDMPVVYVFIVLFSILIFQQLKGPKVELNGNRLWLWLIIAILFAFSMVGSAGINFKYRTAFVTEIAVIVGLTTLILPLWQQFQTKLLVVIPASGILLLIWTMDFVLVLEQYLTTYQHQLRRAELLSVYSQKKIDNIYIPSMKIPGVDGLKDDVVKGRYFLRDVHGDKIGNKWRNTSYANYYGFDFARRVDKPYLLFLPELLNNSVWKIHKNEQKMLIFSRLELYGFDKIQALYLISPQKACIKNFSIQKNELKKKYISKPEVSIINSIGLVDKSYCVSRLALDENLEKVSINSSRFRDLTIDLNSNLKIKQLPAYMHIKIQSIKKWKACRLPRNSQAIVNPFFCSVTNTDNMAKGILTYGPYYPILPGLYRASIKYKAEGNAGTWDQVIQFNGDSQYISQHPLPDSQGKILTLNFDFSVEKPQGKLEIRSYYNGMGKLSIFSVEVNSLNRE